MGTNTIVTSKTKLFQAQGYCEAAFQEDRSGLPCTPSTTESFRTQQEPDHFGRAMRLLFGSGIAVIAGGGQA